MALMICVECGQEVSDRAKVCGKCGYPIQEHIKEVGKQVRISFPHKGQIFKDKCAILTEQGDELGTLEQGETLYFNCPQAMDIFVKVKALASWNSWGKSTKTVYPGKHYEIRTNFVGKISLLEVR